MFLHILIYLKLYKSTCKHELNMKKMYSLKLLITIKCKYSSFNLSTCFTYFRVYKKTFVTINTLSTVCVGVFDLFKNNKMLQKVILILLINVNQLNVIVVLSALPCILNRNTKL